MKIVYADMVGDMFHKGHVNFLKRLSEISDKLIIGVISDKDCESYKRIPVCTLDERVAVIEACKYVDEVISGSPLRLSEEFIEKNNIDIVAHAHSKEDHSQDEFFSVPIRLGKFLRLDYSPGISTTDIIKRCKSK